MARNDLLEPPVRPDGLQIDDDRAAQERFWRAERVAHVVLGLFVVLALLGLFGANGPLARGTLASPAGSIDYVRIARWETAGDVDVVFGTDRPTHTLTIRSRDFASLTVDPVQPPPAEAVALPDGIRLTVHGEGARTLAALQLTPSAIGPMRLEFTLDDAPPVTATMFVLP